MSVTSRSNIFVIRVPGEERENMRKKKCVFFFKCVYFLKKY